MPAAAQAAFARLSGGGSLARNSGDRPRRQGGDLAHLAGEDGLEGRLETAMGLLQRRHAAGDHVILREYLLHGAGLLARELSIDIGYEQFVTEFGHGGVVVPWDRGSRPWHLAALARRQPKRSARLALARISRAAIVSGEESSTRPASSKIEAFAIDEEKGAALLRRQIRPRKLAVSASTVVLFALEKADDSKLIIAGFGPTHRVGVVAQLMQPQPIDLGEGTAIERRAALIPVLLGEHAAERARRAAPAARARSPTSTSAKRLSRGSMVMRPCRMDVCPHSACTEYFLAAWVCWPKLRGASLPRESIG